MQVGNEPLATVAWLARHDFSYKELVMMRYADKAARIAAGSHGAFKAAAYHKSGAILSTS